jgi:DNA mismatch endonuclease (patch repair protein)
MADVHSKETRSYNMSRIRSKDTKPEMMVRKYLFSCGFRFRLHNSKLPGKPDIVLSKYKTVIFVHGCFWHGHENCKYAVTPKSNTEYWNIKIAGNSSRHLLVTNALKALGWKVIVIWECDLKKNCYQQSLSNIVNQLKVI